MLKKFTILLLVTLCFVVLTYQLYILAVERDTSNMVINTNIKYSHVNVLLQTSNDYQKNDINDLMSFCPIKGDHWKGDISMKSVYYKISSAEECNNQCIKYNENNTNIYNQCNGWTFVKNKRTCWLKSEFDIKNIKYDKSSSDILLSGTVNCTFNGSIIELPNILQTQQKNLQQNQSKIEEEIEIKNGTMGCYRYDKQTMIELQTTKLIVNKRKTLDIDAILKYDVDNYLYYLLNNNILKIFVMQNARRKPNIHTTKCQIDIDFISVFLTYYIGGDGMMYSRDKCQHYNSKCQSYDIVFAYNYLYKRYKDKYKYILILEDDISFCPYLFEFIYNISIIDEYKPIDMVFLGHGYTSYLMKTEFIPIFIDKYVNYYYEHKIYEIGVRGTALDAFIKQHDKFNDIQENSLINNIYTADETFTFHDKSQKIISILQHIYEAPKQCYTRNNMRHLHLYAIETKTMNIVPSRFIFFNEHYQVKDKCKHQNIVTNNTNLTSFVIVDCYDLIKKEMNGTGNVIKYIINSNIVNSKSKIVTKTLNTNTINSNPTEFCPVSGDHFGGDISGKAIYTQIATMMECNARCLLHNENNKDPNNVCNGWTYSTSFHVCYLKKIYDATNITSKADLTLLSGPINCKFLGGVIKLMSNHKKKDELMHINDTIDDININGTMSCYRYDAVTKKRAINNTLISNDDSIISFIQDDIDNYLYFLLNNNILKILVMQNCRRKPNIHTTKCQIDIDYISVCLTYYIGGDGMIYSRDKCKHYNSKCQSYDIVFAYNYLYKRYKNKYKYVLILEDDISFCPALFEFIYNISIIDEYKPIDMVFLGNGYTSYLMKIAFIPIFIDKYVNYYYENKIYEIGVHGTALDAFIKIHDFFNDIKENSLINNIYTTDQTVTFHDKSENIASTLRHWYQDQKQCYIKNNMRWYHLYAIQLKTLNIIPSRMYNYQHRVNKECEINIIRTNHPSHKSIITNCTHIIAQIMKKQKGANHLY